MAQSFFLKMDGVDGECAVEGHKKEIQVLSWSHSFNQPTSPEPHCGRRRHGGAGQSCGFQLHQVHRHRLGAADEAMLERQDRCLGFVHRLPFRTAMPWWNT